ncbi:uncharacterized protein C8Q71DRAFT_47846 [Rhodofomes roseus]|uniref:Uncharacterized protein n=1 Tax=Rhodofomes roseus TaxID=34475 RepID=A0ABQ8KG75_9APHY|nr:uncharacterized protein C8Q71DRAFT_47846 [Rhodofomes roseus]KAH9836560.1 hypothetical protein C8Q71DRAFT_47846 [Rhodofomes roseus]
MSSRKCSGLRRLRGTMGMVICAGVSGDGVREQGGDEDESDGSNVLLADGEHVRGEVGGAVADVDGDVVGDGNRKRRRDFDVLEDGKQERRHKYYLVLVLVQWNMKSAFSIGTRLGWASRLGIAMEILGSTSCSGAVLTLSVTVDPIAGQPCASVCQ